MIAAVERTRNRKRYPNIGINGGECLNRNIIRGLVVVCVLSLLANAYFGVRHLTQRSSNYHDMAMVPCYLSVALSSYQIEFNKDKYPATIHYQLGNPSLQMAFASFTSSESLYSEYGYDTSWVYGFLDQLRNSSDSTAYHDFLGIKSHLPNRFVKPSDIQPLFNAMAADLKKM